MKPRLHALLLLALGLSLVLAPVASAQGPGPTPSPQLPAPDAGGAPKQPSAQPQYNPSASQTGETLIVPFSNGTIGVQTVNSYTGPLRVTVSGVGQGSSTAWSDAFYIYTDYEGNPIQPVHPTEYYNWMLWINGGPADNFVDPIPPYNPEHVYTFEMIAPGGLLTFAVGDTGTDDNTGEYTVVIERIPLEASIDIRPFTDPNTILCATPNFLINVALLTTPDFDALSVDHTTVTFEGAMDVESYVMGETPRRERDVDRDGDLDLFFVFRLSDTALTADSVEGTLLADTYGGRLVVATDSVQMLGCIR